MTLQYWNDSANEVLATDDEYLLEMIKAEFDDASIIYEQVEIIGTDLLMVHPEDLKYAKRIISGFKGFRGL